MKPATINYITGAVAVVLVAGAVVVGLNACDDTAPEPTSTAATTTDTGGGETPVSVEETPAPVEETPPQVVGAVITADQADKLPEGQTAYELADGSLVVVQADQPLPEAIRAEVATESAALYEEKASWATDDEHVGLVYGTDAKTGKKTIVITQQWGSFDGTYYQNTWVSIKKQDGKIQSTTDLDTQILNAQAFVAAQPDAALWEIIVVQP